MTAPFDPDGLWTKAVLFINRSHDAATFAEQALWASLSLELLAKAALAKVNPCLIADPSDDGKSLLIAAGLVSDYSGFKTAQAKTVFSRCARAFPPFSADEANRIAQNRNEDLHSASLPFEAVPAAAWWQRYWAQAALLLTAQERSLEEFVGFERLDEVEAVLAENARNVQSRVQGLISRAGQRLEMVASGTISVKLAQELAAASRMQLSAHSTTVECPVCANPAYLGGEYEHGAEVHFEEESGEAFELVQVYAELFGCPTCGLLLDRPEFVLEAGLPEEFEIERPYEPDQGDYGND